MGIQRKLQKMDREERSKSWEEVSSWSEAVEYIETRLRWLEENHLKLFGGRLDAGQKKCLEQATHSLQRAKTHNPLYKGVFKAILHLDLDACRKEWEKRQSYLPQEKRQCFEKVMLPILTDPDALQEHINDEGIWSDFVDSDQFYGWCEQVAIRESS